MKHIIYGPGVLGGDLGAKLLLDISEKLDRKIILPNIFLVTYWPDALKAIAESSGVLPVTKVRGLTHEALCSILLPKQFSCSGQNGNFFEEEILSLGVTVTPVRQGLRNSYNWGFNQRLIPEERGPAQVSFPSNV